jgi:DNA-binding XRE family transcriptional regulator
MEMHERVQDEKQRQNPAHNRTTIGIFNPLKIKMSFQDKELVIQAIQLAKSKAELARKIKVSPNTIYAWQINRVKPSMISLGKLKRYVREATNNPS